MKKLLVALLSVFTMQAAHADNDKPVTVAQLPAKAQTFLNQAKLPERESGIRQDGKGVPRHQL